MPNARDRDADVSALRKELESTRAKLERQAAELSDGQFAMVKRNVKVTIGGCGG